MMYILISAYTMYNVGGIWMGLWCTLFDETGDRSRIIFYCQELKEHGYYVVCIVRTKCLQ